MTGGKWSVVCDEWAVTTSSEAGAQRLLAEIERSGHCQETHRLELGIVAPRPADRPPTGTTAGIRSASSTGD